MAHLLAQLRKGSLIAGYRVEDQLGRGGMGIVYRARHVQLERLAAVKVIVPELTADKSFRRRFIAEARAAAAVNHPNIISIYDAGEDEGMLFIAMQYINGEDLETVLQRETWLSPQRTLNLLGQVARALDAAHSHGLIHRDVKPANIMLENETAYLTDFGLTKQRTRRLRPLTDIRDVVGTLYYAAPEQIESSKVDSRADVYALGCLLFHCLVGEPPFVRESNAAIMYAHLNDSPPLLSNKRPELPRGLNIVIAKALEKDPSRRFESCSELINAAETELNRSQLAGQLLSTVPAQGDSPGVATVVERRPTLQLAEPLTPIAESGSSESGAPVTQSTAPITEMKPASRAQARSRVLLAGLEGATRALAHVALGGRYEVHETNSAREFLELVRQQRPDIVVIDFKITNFTTATLMRQMRKDPIARSTKILLLVDWKASTHPETLAAGADEMLTTPFSPLQFQVKLRKLLGEIPAT